MKTFKLHWNTNYNQIQIVEGNDIADALNKAGIGRGALPALDYWEEIKEVMPKEK